METQNVLQREHVECILEWDWESFNKAKSIGNDSRLTDETDYILFMGRGNKLTGL